MKKCILISTCEKLFYLLIFIVVTIQSFNHFVVVLNDLLVLGVKQFFTIFIGELNPTLQINAHFPDGFVFVWEIKSIFYINAECLHFNRVMLWRGSIPQNFIDPSGLPSINFCRFTGRRVHGQMKTLVKAFRFKLAKCQTSSGVVKITNTLNFGGWIFHCEFEHVLTVILHADCLKKIGTQSHSLKWREDQNLANTRSNFFRVDIISKNSGESRDSERILKFIVFVFFKSDVIIPLAILSI